ncbi:MAG: hypothetical protein K9M55_09025 [Candidatus Marinimicrobia bacterium]|nr:hypothetical protein [Candidatus Neomarinimicrobiota bacterium]MCF7922830.1 hypothetical protein [Candidatus Neomarinimicrobiota bacterium]
MLNNYMKIFILVLITFMTNVFAQVTISPTTLFIDGQQRFETLLIMNSSNATQEIQLSWQFGYPKADENGDIAMIYDDAEEAAKHSAADWIRGFPKRFILEPGARQTVRVTVKAPRDLEPGTYWSRLKTTSNALSTEIGQTAAGGISANINIQFNQVTAVFYKHGELTTGIQIEKTRSVVEDKMLHVLTNYKKTGNSPFLGTMSAKISDSSGKVVKEGQVLLSIYYDGLRRIDLDIADLPKDTYDVEVSISSGRGDILEGDTIQAPTVTARSSFTTL